MGTNHSNPTTYSIVIQPVGDHLQVTLPELGLVVETDPGQMSDSDAFDAAHLAIERASLNMDTAPEHKVPA